MKKTIVLLLALCLVLLTACGPASPTDALKADLENAKSSPEEIMGEMGEDGAPGAAGKSAYELAKENGLTDAATEEEWIKSLQGKDGVDGTIDFSTLTFGVNAEGYLTINGNATTQKVADLKPAA